MNHQTLLLGSFLFLLLLSTTAYPLAQLAPSSAASSSSSSPRASPSASPLPPPDRWLTQFDRWLILFGSSLMTTGLVMRFLRRHPELAERIPPGVRDYVVRGRFDAWEARTQRQLLGLRQLLGKGHPLYPCMHKCCRDVLTANLLSLDRYTFGTEAMTLEEAFVICGRPDQCGLDEQTMASALERANPQQQAPPQSAPPSPSPSPPSSSPLSLSAGKEQGSSLPQPLLPPPSISRKDDDRLGNGQAHFLSSTANAGYNGERGQNEHSPAQLLRTAPTPAAGDRDEDDKAKTMRGVLDALSQHARETLAGTGAGKEGRGRSAQIHMLRSPLPLTAPFLSIAGGGIPGSKALPALPLIRH